MDQIKLTIALCTATLVSYSAGWGMCHLTQQIRRSVVVEVERSPELLDDEEYRRRLEEVLLGAAIAAEVKPWYAYPGGEI